MLDLTGVLVTEIRDFPAVSAITPRVRGGELTPGDAPPAVVIVRAGRTRSPFGAGRERMRLQDSRWYVRCYGATEIQTAQLSGAVSDAVHAKGPRRDTQGRLIYLSSDEGSSGTLVDPDTKWPYEVLTIRAIGSA